MRTPAARGTVVGAAKNSASEIGVEWISASYRPGPAVSLLELLQAGSTIDTMPMSRSAVFRTVRIALQMVGVLQG